MIERTLLTTNSQHVIKPAPIQQTFFHRALLETAQQDNHQAPFDPTRTPRASLFNRQCSHRRGPRDRNRHRHRIEASLSLNQIGAAVTVIDQETIRNQGAQTLADLLLGYPGISVSRQGPNGTLTQVRMRGAEANHVLVLIDGVEANDVTQGSEFNFAQFPSIKSSVLRSPVVHKARCGAVMHWRVSFTSRPVRIQATSLALPSPLPFGNRDANRIGIEWGNRWNNHQLNLGFNHCPLQNRTSLESAETR